MQGCKKWVVVKEVGGGAANLHVQFYQYFCVQNVPIFVSPSLRRAVHDCSCSNADVWSSWQFEVAVDLDVMGA